MQKNKTELSTVTRIQLRVQLKDFHLTIKLMGQKTRGLHQETRMGKGSLDETPKAQEMKA